MAEARTSRAGVPECSADARQRFRRHSLRSFLPALRRRHRGPTGRCCRSGSGHVSQSVEHPLCRARAERRGSGQSRKSCGQARLSWWRTSQTAVRPAARRPLAGIAGSALVLPVPRAGSEGFYGALVAGVSPRRALDSDYRAFFDIVTSHIAQALANAEAYEEERQARGGPGGNRSRQDRVLLQREP